MAGQFRRQLRSLSDIAKTFIDPLLSKQGFVGGSMLKDWSTIVGQHYAQTVHPEKVIFPKGKNSEGTLYVCAQSSGVAFLFEHAKTDILKRINGYYGYPALSSIRIKTSHHYKQPVPKKNQVLSVDEQVRIQEQLGDVGDDGLKDILSRLGMAITLDEKELKRGRL